jgi:hypothetical protein
MFAFGTSEHAHADLMLYGIRNAACDASRGNPPSERDINHVLAAVAGIGAKDEIEGMPATQMVATHTAIITTLHRQKQSETLLERERYANLAVKLLRTFAAQVEALQRHRGKGQQHIRVEHVDAHSGGQAIVGAVTAGEGGKGPQGIKSGCFFEQRRRATRVQACSLCHSLKAAAALNCGRSRRLSSSGGPGVRIPYPPAESLRNFGP